MTGEVAVLHKIIDDLERIRDDEEVEEIHWQKCEPDYHGNRLVIVQIHYFHGKRPCRMDVDVQ